MAYFDRHYGSKVKGYTVGSSSYFDKKVFVGGGKSPYINPRTGSYYQSSNPITSHFHWTDILNHALGLSPFLLLF